VLGTQSNDEKSSVFLLLIQLNLSNKIDVTEVNMLHLCCQFGSSVIQCVRSFYLTGGTDGSPVLFTGGFLLFLRSQMK